MEMAEENIERELSQLGFGGAEPSPLTGVVSDLAIKAAQKQIEEKADEYSFWDLIMERQMDAGTIPSAMALFDRPCLLYTSPSPRDVEESRMPSSA